MGIGQNGKVKKAGVGIPHVVCGVTADADREQYDPGRIKPIKRNTTDFIKNPPDKKQPTVSHDDHASSF